ncbi:Carboxylesterase patB [Colletotrichum gloeosporioides]|uniref:Carboxylic ester hydrolase n=1 Tax=Colletotrichum gloeosporioides TaxID=474922 RepID=A0A8H4FDN3_COLGL|nr:Carboxylesterase patB [Colletotrichum gloeosporioides]KAF3797179.1 Carboxylesterase patB [Colletotrichum gloeosporioides]
MRLIINSVLSSIIGIQVVSGSLIFPSSTLDTGFTKRPSATNVAGKQQTGGFYNFSNIRYAAPPIDNLRFRAPEPPATSRSVVETGASGRLCPQSSPAWLSEAIAFVTNVTQGLAFNSSAFREQRSANTSTTPVRQPDPRTNEDCLVLDVVVPKSAFEQHRPTNISDSSVPVLVWFHGGGYTTGSKDQFGGPAGLLEQATAFEPDGLVFVAINYRLGAFGWSAGPTIQSDGAANVGLLDQRLALYWVQEHISKFGGDPKKVTIMGESAGGGSLIHHITVKSLTPCTVEVLPENHLLTLYFLGNLPTFLTLLNVSTLAEARKLPSSALIAANSQQVAQSPYGQFTYNPVIDHGYVPSHQATLFARGQFDRYLYVVFSHNANEGLIFTDPSVTDGLAFRGLISELFPSFNATLVEHIAEILYPPVFDGIQPYIDNLGRGALLMAKTRIVCNTLFLRRAFRNASLAYIFAVPPSSHGDDLKYTFYNGAYGAQMDSRSLNATIAEVLQDCMVSYAISGKPTTDVSGVDVFPKVGSKSTAWTLDVAGVQSAVDDAVKDTCSWWQANWEAFPDTV